MVPWPDAGVLTTTLGPSVHVGCVATSPMAGFKVGHYLLKGPYFLGSSRFKDGFLELLGVLAGKG